MKTITLDEFIDAMPFVCSQHRSKIKSIISDFAKELLELAAENAETKYDPNRGDGWGLWVVNDKSILNTINQIV